MLKPRNCTLQLWHWKHIRNGSSVTRYSPPRKYSTLTHHRGPLIIQLQKVQRILYHNQKFSSGQDDSSDSRSWIGIFGIIVGSGILGIGSVLCQRKAEDKIEERGDDKLEDKMTVKDDNLQGEDVVGNISKTTNTIKKYLESNNGKRNRNKVKALDNIPPETFDEAVIRSRKLLCRHMVQMGAPGLVVAVSVDGKTVWAHGFGFSDLENNVRCNSETVMRIASISKSLTMTAIAKLWEEGKLDLDAPIQKYMPYFPVKMFEGKEVTITTRHLLCHQSGIRHYKLKDPKKNKNDTSNSKQSSKESKSSCDAKQRIMVEGSESKKQSEGKAQNDIGSLGKEEQADVKNDKSIEELGKESHSSDKTEKEEVKDSQTNSTNPQKKRMSIQKLLQGKSNTNNKKKKEEKEDEFDMKEYYIKEKFDSIEDAVKLFQDDELFFEPGEGFLYTTHGWTLVSGVVEGAAGKPFTQVITNLFHELGLNDTYLDKHDPIIYNRARCYIRDKHWKLLNAPYVDNSYKWAGGGYLSTVHDLTKFGNAMLYASQRDDHQNNGNLLPGYLKSSTMHDLWTPVNGTNNAWDKDGGYGLGWGAVTDKQTYGFCREARQYASHTGGAVGASSVLLVLPQKKGNEGKANDDVPPKGIVVALITNMQGVSLNRVALQIAKWFESLSPDA